MKIQVFILIALVLLALLISLGGCLATTQEEPWMFYQAHDPSHLNAPAPFFLTMKEAQFFANRMNKDSNVSYQVGFISR